MLTVAMPDPDYTCSAGSSMFPELSIAHENTFPDPSLEDLLLGPDSSIWDWLEKDVAADTDINNCTPESAKVEDICSSSFHEHTPALTMSPRTSLAPNLEIYDLDNDHRFLQTASLTEDEHQNAVVQPIAEYMEIAGSLEQTPFKDRKKTPYADKTPRSHPFECRQCSMRFRHSGEQRKHEKNVHAPRSTRPHQCRQCGKRFNWPKDVKRHVSRVHKGHDHGLQEGCRQSEDDAQDSGLGKTLDDAGILEPAFDPGITFETDTVPIEYDPFNETCSISHTQQDWLCDINNPAHHTFSRTHSPGKGSAPHRGARV